MQPITVPEGRSAMLELRSVSKSYPGAGQVLREVSLRVEPGQALCLAGGNAEGKTTLLEIAAGLRRPDSGEVLRPTETALVPQRPAILGELTAADNLALWYAAAGRRERPFSPGSPEEKLGLSPFARRRAGRLSGGMQRRLSIAAALCSRPGTLLLDEPFAALDAGGRTLVHAALADFVQAGGAVLFSSHEPQQIAALAGALVRLRGGTLEGPFPLTAPPGAKRTGQVLALLLNDPSKAWEPPR